MIKTSAPGNIFFLGEHAVVYGYPAIIAAVGKRTFCTIKKSKGKTVKLSSSAFGKASATINSGLTSRKGEKELNPVFDLIHNIAKKFKIKNGCEIKISSQIPVESGMSSSTAVLSAVLMALSESYQLGIEKEKYFDYLYQLQAKIHGGKASGSEIISSSLGGYNRIHKGEKKIDWKNLGENEFSIVIGNTKIRSPTSLTVGSHIPSLMKRDLGFVNSCFKSIQELEKTAEQAIEQGDPVMLGRIMDRNQELLSKLMLSHPKLDDCIREAKRAGAYGAKLSGSGWGGVMFALVSNDNCGDVAKAIESTGSEAIITDIGGEGVRVEI